MKLVKFLNKPKSFNNLMRQSLESLSDSTPLQLRHQLKENWDSWVDIIEERGVYKNIDNIIYNRYSRNIDRFSKIKPCNIEVQELTSKNEIEDIYNEINNIVEGYENLTVSALMWATLCDNSVGKMRLNKYLEAQNHNYSKDLLEIFMVMHHDELLNESIDINKILQKIGFTFSKEKGLIQLLRDAGKQMYTLFKALLIAWYTNKEEDRQSVRDIIDSTNITRDHVADFLFKLDEATLHLLTGPIYILGAITGWKIRPKSPYTKAQELSVENKIKNALQQLSTVVSDLPRKVAKNFKSYLKGMSNLVCKDLGVCGGQ